VTTFTVEKMNPCSLRFSLLSLTACLSCVFFSFFTRSSSPCFASVSSLFSFSPPPFRSAAEASI
jgi:hypothetical protein